MPLELPHRPRRNRRTPAIQELVRETSLGPSDLIYPVFIDDTQTDTPLASMPGLTRYGCAGDCDSLHTLMQQVLLSGVCGVMLFPKIDDARKTPTGEEAANPDGLIPRVIRKLKRDLPSLCVMTDVALDPYSSDGHDGLVSPRGEVLNDETVEVLCRQAVTQADAGADVVGPSDMMDGRVGAIRAALDGAGHTHVGILAYTAKYASCFYGPFRGALDSAPRQAEHIPVDKATYQMDPANAREAVREARLDETEGADMIMVKPAGPYLDVIHRVRQATDLPVAAYQVSGEYLMIKAACEKGWLDERDAVMESLIGIKRAGADMILTYFAPDVADWLG